MNKGNIDKMAYTLAEASAAVGVSVPVMSEWVHIPGFPAFKAGKRWVIPVAGLTKWLEEQAQRGGIVGA